MPRRKSGPEPADGAQAAAYIADVTGSLAGLARRHGLDTLGYILDMAREEAESRARSGNGSRRN
jgi:hypothetical protein